jgi:SAM-dependent methyltransferase
MFVAVTTTTIENGHWIGRLLWLEISIETSIQGLPSDAVTPIMSRRLPMSKMSEPEEPIPAMISDRLAPSAAETFRFPGPTTGLEAIGERNLPGTLGDIQSEHYHRYLFALRLCADRDVLDIASGKGYGSHLLGQVARSVTGVDVDDGAVAHASSRFQTGHVTFKTGSGTALPLPAASVDIVVSFETLEHFATPTEFVREVRRVLRPDGIIVVSSPNRRIHSDQSAGHRPFPVRELDRDQFVALLEGGFRNVRLFEQRLLSGSIILRALTGDEKTLLEGFETTDRSAFARHGGVPNPVCFIAVATNGVMPPYVDSIVHTPSFMNRIEVPRAEDRTARLHGEQARYESLAGAYFELRRGFAQLLRTAAAPQLEVKRRKRLISLNFLKIGASKSRRLWRDGLVRRKSNHFIAEAAEERVRADARAVAASSLFDAAWYLERNHDVRAAGLERRIVSLNRWDTRSAEIVIHFREGVIRHAKSLFARFA